jgi:predicted Zn-dependent protease
MGRAGPQPTLLDTQALVFLRAGKIKEAIRLLEDLVVESPKERGYHFHLAQAHLANGNRPDAKRSFEQAGRLGLTKGTLHPLEQQGYEQLRQVFPD